ncbi:aldo/keto reductase [Candidatus Latescibacterota bacterium]
MDYVRLGCTDLEVSEVGLGTVQLGMPYGLGTPDPPDDAAVVSLLRRAHDLGITYFDTAAVYGRSEGLVGQAFDGLSSRPVVATKVTLRRDGNSGRLEGHALRSHIHDSVERSLTRLRLSSLDLLQIHSVEDTFVSDELIEIMEELCEAGKVRYWGATTYGDRAPVEVLRHPQILQALQVAYSLLDRRMDVDIIPRCRQLGVGVILRSIFLKGVLSDRRQRLVEELAPLQRAAAEAATCAAGLGIPLPELALRFALFESGAHVTLFGTTSVAELEGNLAALAAGRLPDETVAALRLIQVEEEALLSPANWPADTTTD